MLTTYLADTNLPLEFAYEWDGSVQLEIEYQIQAIPLPAPVMLGAMGLIGVPIARRRMARKA